MGMYELFYRDRPWMREPPLQVTLVPALFRDRLAETVFCFALLLSLPRFFVEIEGSRYLRGITLIGGHTRDHSNDTAAIATLRNLASAQAQMQTTGKIYGDSDGIGEYGTFGEMTGSCGVRTDADGSGRGAAVRPAILSAALANASSGGIVTKNGYCFRIHLPAKGSGASREGKVGEPLAAPVDADAAEQRWCAYAWPVAAGTSGRRAFFVDQDGDVRQCDNAGGAYSGVFRAPAFDAAFAPGAEGSWTGAAGPPGSRSRDGLAWKVKN